MVKNRFKLARKSHRAIKNEKGGKAAQRCRSLNQWIKRADQFGQPIKMTYKGRETFQTSWGGCLSILFILSMVWLILNIFGQAISQPFKSRKVFKELVNPNLSAQNGSESAAETEPMVIENPNDLLEFINVDAFTDQEVLVTLELQQQDIYKIGKERVFAENCEKTCQVNSPEPFKLVES